MHGKLQAQKWPLTKPYQTRLACHTKYTPQTAEKEIS